MRTARQTAAALEEFRSEHSHTVDNALMLQAERMRESAAEIQASYDEIKDDPAARAAQDATLITTEGLRIAAQMAQEAANRAEAARTAWAELTQDGD